jgi:hypothetical protein
VVLTIRHFLTYYFNIVADTTLTERLLMTVVVNGAMGCGQKAVR